MGARRASVAAVAAVVGAVLLVTLLVTWASSIGPGGVLAGDGPATHRATTSSTPTPSATASGTATSRPREHDAGSASGDDSVVRAVVAVLLVGLAVGALGLLLLLGRRAWEAWRDRRRPPPPPPEIVFDVIEAPRRVADEITRDATRQRVLLQGGTPRNGIVACWHRFEEQAAAAGVVRRQWETSAEFTLRVLELVDAGSGPVSRLGALYREARFSDHPLDEDAREAALAALDAIHAGLGVRAGAGS